MVDGDTIQVRLDSGPITVRLHGIDTPEASQSLGKAATKALRSRVEGEPLEIEPIEQNDGYGRMVAKVFVRGDDVNARMVESGYAWAYRRYLRHEPVDERYCRLEAEARAAGRGVWAGAPEHWQPPWEFRARSAGPACRRHQLRRRNGGAVHRCASAGAAPAARGAPVSRGPHRDRRVPHQGQHQCARASGSITFPARPPTPTPGIDTGQGRAVVLQRRRGGARWLASSPAVASGQSFASSSRTSALAGASCAGLFQRLPGLVLPAERQLDAPDVEPRLALAEDGAAGAGRPGGDEELLRALELVERPLLAAAEHGGREEVTDGVLEHDPGIVRRQLQRRGHFTVRRDAAGGGAQHVVAGARAEARRVQGASLGVVAAPFDQWLQFVGCTAPGSPAPGAFGMPGMADCRSRANAA